MVIDNHEHNNEGEMNYATSIFFTKASNRMDSDDKFVTLAESER